MILRVCKSIFLLSGALLCATAAYASVIYDESVSGDLSNSGTAPTLLTVSLGSNELFGTTGKTGNIIDRDYFTFTVPGGMLLSAITVLPGTQTLGPLGDSFIGMEAGPEVTLGTQPDQRRWTIGVGPLRHGRYRYEHPAFHGLGRHGRYRLYPSAAGRHLFLLGSGGECGHRSLWVRLHDRNPRTRLLGDASRGLGTACDCLHTSQKA